MTNDLRVPQSLWRFQASFMPQDALKEVLSSMGGGGDVLGDWGGSLPIWPVGCDQTEPKNGSIFQGVRSSRRSGRAVLQPRAVLHGERAQTIAFRWNLRRLNILQCPAVCI